MKNENIVKIDEHSKASQEDYDFLNDDEIFTDEDIKLLDDLNKNNRKLKISKHPNGGWKLRSYSWVGTIEFENLILHILPKFEDEIEDLITMIEFSHGIDLTLYDHTQSFSPGNNYLAELIARMFKCELNILLKRGIKKGYIHREESLNTLKGRPNIRRQLIKQKSVPIPIECDFDDYSSNIPENQIIYDTLKVLYKTSIGSELLSWTSQMIDYFYPICSEGFIQRDWNNYDFSYTRTNSHYKEIHRICKLILGGKGIDEIFVQNRHNIHAFLINMNYLFEKFIKSILDLTKDYYQIKYQKKRKMSILKGDGSSYKKIKPDFLVYTKKDKKLLSVIDVKYKQYSDKNVSNSDIYQLFFYGYAFSGKDKKKMNSILIYPGDERESSLLRLRDKSGQERKLHIRSINLKDSFRDIQQQNLENLKERAIDLISI